MLDPQKQKKYFHLRAADYSINFPEFRDILPTLIQKRTYIDDFIFNLLYEAIINLQQYLITNKYRIENRVI